ncbi:heavy metal translocating P-type ATPase [Deltaproteobacteria bacterium TL4]
MTPSPSSCRHCQTPLHQNRQIFYLNYQEKQIPFCCSGCATVWQIITENQLASYYEKRELSGKESLVDLELEKNFSHFDKEVVQQTYVQFTAEGLAESNLLLTQLHCAACIWLIESYLLHQTGVLQACVNFGTQRLQVTWNPEEIRFSEILERLQRLGYPAVPYDINLQEKQRKHSSHQMLSRLAVAGFSAGNVMMLSVSLYAGYFKGISQEYKMLLESVSGLLTLPVVFYSAIPFWKGARSALKTRHPNMDLLIALGILITFGYSISALFLQTGEPYFDSCVMLVFFLLIGRALEHRTQTHVMNISERFIGMTPRFATRIEGTQELTITQEAIQLGDHLRVRQGDRVPVDGTVFTGESEIDESALTGESRWRLVTTNDQIWGGTLNQNGVLVLSATAIGPQTLLNRIAKLVEQALQQKSHIQRLADRIASRFVWIVLFLAIGTWSWWLWNDSVPAGKSAWLIAVSVLIIACPCALGLATPTAIFAATGHALGKGWLIKRAAWLEQPNTITDIVFDKTGTLTTGEFEITQIQTLEGSTEQAWEQYAVLLESHTRHPIAHALIHAAKQKNGSLPTGSIAEVQQHPGRGVSGMIRGVPVLSGNLRLMQEQQVKINSVLPQPSQTTLYVYVAIDGVLQGYFGLRDALHEKSQATLAKMRSLGIRTHMLSGDLPERVQYYASLLQIDQAQGEVLPQEKQSYIANLQAMGHKVIMVGDGLNDAPALIQSDLGIAVNTASDISSEAADVILMHNALHQIPELLQLSAKTRRTILQNFAISLFYNACTLPLAMMGWINPLFAAIAMASSSILVTLNALRLR